MAPQRGRHLGAMADRAAARGAAAQAAARPGSGDRRGARRPVRRRRVTAGRGRAGGARPPYRPSVRRRTSVMSNLDACMALCRADLAHVRGDADHVAEYARAALARSDEADELLREMAQVLLAETDWLAGRLAEAERALTGILLRWSSSQEWLVLQRVGFDLGSVQLAQGRLAAALRTYRTLGARTDAAAPALSGMSHVGVAMVLYERDELAEAAAEADAGVERCRRLAYAVPLLDGLVVLARIRLAQGDRAGALAAIEEAATVLPEARARRVPLGVWRAELAFAMGDLGAAADWVRGRGLYTRRRARLPGGRRIPAARPAADRRRRPAAGRVDAGPLAGFGRRSGPHCGRHRRRGARIAGARRRPRRRRRAGCAGRGADAGRARGPPAGVPRRGRPAGGGTPPAAGRSAVGGPCRAVRVATGVPRPPGRGVRPAGHARPSHRATWRGDGARAGRNH